MDRSKFIAIVTGAISLILAIGYLLLVQLLDFRGEMIPAPQSYFFAPTQATQVRVAIQPERLGISHGVHGSQFSAG